MPPLPPPLPPPPSPPPSFPISDLVAPLENDCKIDRPVTVVEDYAPDYTGVEWEDAAVGSTKWKILEAGQYDPVALAALMEEETRAFTADMASSDGPWQGRWSLEANDNNEAFALGLIVEGTSNTHETVKLRCEAHCAHHLHWALEHFVRTEGSYTHRVCSACELDVRNWATTPTPPYNCRLWYHLGNPTQRPQIKSNKPGFYCSRQCMYDAPYRHGPPGRHPSSPAYPPSSPSPPPPRPARPRRRGAPSPPTPPKLPTCVATPPVGVTAAACTVDAACCSGCLYVHDALMFCGQPQGGA